jgi:hypothetical protein
MQEDLDVLVYLLGTNFLESQHQLLGDQKY